MTISGNDATDATPMLMLLTDDWPGEIPERE